MWQQDSYSSSPPVGKTCYKSFCSTIWATLYWLMAVLRKQPVPKTIRLFCKQMNLGESSHHKFHFRLSQNSSR